MVEQLGNDDLCLQCNEIDARLALHIGVAAQDLTKRMIGVALDYLHPDDVRAVVAELSGEREPATQRLATLQVRSHVMVANRVSRTSRGIGRHDPRPVPPMGLPGATACDSEGAADPTE